MAARWCLRVGVALALGGSLLLSGEAGSGADAADGMSRWKLAYEGSDWIGVVRVDGSGRHRTTLPGLPDPSPDGRKLTYTSRTGSHMRLYIADRGGRGRRFLTQSEDDCLGAVWSPDSKRLLFTSGCDLAIWRIGVVDADGSGGRVLTGRWSANAAWSPDGRTIAFTRLGCRCIVLMDEDGRNQRPIRGHYPRPDPAGAYLTWSRDGRRVFFLPYQTSYVAPRGLWVMNRDGSGAQILTPALPKVRDFELSPDGRKIVLSAPGRPDRGWEIYSVNTDGSGLRQLTHNRGVHDVGPRWSPDARKLAFSRGQNGGWKLYVMNADGSSQIKLGNSSIEEEEFGWLPAGSPL